MCIHTCIQHYAARVRAHTHTQTYASCLLLSLCPLSSRLGILHSRMGYLTSLTSLTPINIADAIPHPPNNSSSGNAGIGGGGLYVPLTASLLFCLIESASKRFFGSSHGRGGGRGAAASRPPSKYAELALGGPSLEKKSFFLASWAFSKFQSFLDVFLDVFGRFWLFGRWIRQN